MARCPQRRWAQCSRIGCIGLRPALLISISKKLNVVFEGMRWNWMQILFCMMCLHLSTGYNGTISYHRTNTLKSQHSLINMKIRIDFVRCHLLFFCLLAFQCYLKASNILFQQRILLDLYNMLEDEFVNVKSMSVETSIVSQSNYN